VDATETARLCRMIASLSPATAKLFDEYTPAMWHKVLADIHIKDALEALERVAARTPWIGTAEICAEVAVIRKARLQASDAADELVPNVDPDDLESYRAERRAIMRAAADGILDPEAYAASGRTLSGVPARKAIGAHSGSEPVMAAIRSGLGKQVPRG
jgi:hypothetical protein